jgi:hypothetical protein
MEIIQQPMNKEEIVNQANYRALERMILAKEKHGHISSRVIEMIAGDIASHTYHQFPCTFEASKTSLDEIRETIYNHLLQRALEENIMGAIKNYAKQSPSADGKYFFVIYRDSKDHAMNIVWCIANKVAGIPFFQNYSVSNFQFSYRENMTHADILPCVRLFAKTYQNNWNEYMH